jgi:uncharacterized OsmC-like protein
VTSAKIVNGEVKTEDIASGAVKIETVERNGERSAPSPGNPLTTSLASCEGNEQLTGGGFSATDSVKIQISAEHDTIPETWIVAGRFDPTGTDSPDFTAHAYCAKIVP